MYEGKRSIAEIPELLAQWDWEKNDALGITPEQATRGKVKKVFWICEKGHSFEARIDHRCSMGANCPYCAGKRPVVGENDVATLYPHLLDEWDNEKNGEKTLKDFVANSNKRVWWKCKKCGESWQTGICHRTSRGSGCPMCARIIRGKSRTTSTVRLKGALSEQRPDLAKEWDFEKNTEITPEKVSAGSNKTVWWKCGKCGFSYKKSIAARSGGNGCPACAGKKVFVGYNDLASLYPELAEEWSPKNNLLPTQVTAGYAGKVWWNCNSCGYEWQAVVYSRTTKGRKGSGCPLCAGKIVIPGLNDFTTTHEEIAKQWDSEKNGNLSPSTLRPHSNKKVWWKCEKGHSWYASVSSRVRGTDCPECAKKRRGISRTKTAAKKRGSLMETNPKLAKEWDYNMNGDLEPSLVSDGSKKKVWWRCKKEHSWEASINSRSRGNGCPDCAKELFTSFPEQAIFYYLSKVTEVKSRYKCEGKEIDVFLPKLLVGIEYNGRYYHSGREEKDAEKKEFLKKIGIRLIVVREGEEEGEEGDTIYYRRESSAYRNIKNVVLWILSVLELPSCDVDIDRDRQEIYALYVEREKENSIAQKHPWLLEEWNYDKNRSLSPWKISAGSSKRVWWRCRKCDYEWEAVVYSRKKHGCPVCGGRKKRNCSEQEKIEGI